MMQKIFSGEIRFKGENGESFPEWEEKKLMDIAECLDNRRKPLNSNERSIIQGNIPYYGANGVVDFVNKYIFNEDIILLAEDGGNFDDFATKPIAQLVKGKSWINNHAHVLKAKYNTDFLFYSLVHKDIRKYINGTSRAKLNKSDMLDILVKMPKSLDEQVKISKFLEKIYTKLEKEQEKLDSLNEWKKGLLQQMFV
ncbi:restriction endonuclease subunit S [Clostridium taeniosporum]|uniref:Type I restriction endonuclease subunit S n=1 Tax=Clostridium taeniosporum TaxID=394958 RepID=A0A2I6SDK4_9CLOT|nr:restriction endonuclease subunit S [Clostridium taeniosporum]AUO15659.1 type I restriction endonuclease subunit S [Clostridium taeniosporum]